MKMFSVGLPLVPESGKRLLVLHSCLFGRLFPCLCGLGFLGGLAQTSLIVAVALRLAIDDRLLMLAGEESECFFLSFGPRPRRLNGGLSSLIIRLSLTGGLGRSGVIFRIRSGR